MLWTKSGEGREDGTDEQVNKDVKERKIKTKIAWNEMQCHIPGTKVIEIR